MTQERTCIICNKILHSSTTRVVGGYDFCMEHGDMIIPMVGNYVYTVLIPKLKNELNSENYR